MCAPVGAPVNPEYVSDTKRRLPSRVNVALPVAVLGVGGTSLAPLSTVVYTMGAAAADKVRPRLAKSMMRKAKRFCMEVLSPRFGGLRAIWGGAPHQRMGQKLRERTLWKSRIACTSGRMLLWMDVTVVL